MPCPHCGKEKKGSDCPADSWAEDVKLAKEAGQDEAFFKMFDEKMKARMKKEPKKEEEEK